MSRDHLMAVLAVGAVIVLALGCNAAIYQAARGPCQQRGGHLEWVWGGNGGWVCVDTSRP